ncbi:MAG: antioxidant, AhpC/TSA family protein [Rariglobus sp.]|nr:antioxidant, AhpC/TSA family protein [Rariglobus sp.]
MIATGQKLDTGFTLKIVRNGKVEEVAFGDLLARPVIVSVYMKNNTPSCDRQNGSLAAHAGEFDRLGYQLIALSRDTCGSHLNYAAKKNIPYVLASDPADAFARATGSVVEKSMYGRTFHGPARAAYVIDTEGTVLAVIGKVDTKDHSAQIREVLAAL